MKWRVFTASQRTSCRAHRRNSRKHNHDMDLVLFPSQTRQLLWLIVKDDINEMERGILIYRVSSIVCM